MLAYRRPMLLSLATVLLTSGFASAEGPGGWRIMFGAPPGPNYRDWDTNGMLAPPGDSPAYGRWDYYKHLPSIVIDEYGARNVHKPPPPPPPEPVPAFPETAAVLRVRVPVDAALWISGANTSQQGNYRVFVTPPLPGDQPLSYELRVRWLQQGQPVERSRLVRVHPGDRLTIDFLTPTAEGDTLIHPPRKLELREQR